VERNESGGLIIRERTLEEALWKRKEIGIESLIVTMETVSNPAVRAEKRRQRR